MKRRNFLKGLAGVAVMPAAAKLGIENDLLKELPEATAEKPMGATRTATGVLLESKLIKRFYAGEDIYAGDFVRLGSDGLAYPVLSADKCVGVALVDSTEGDCYVSVC